MSSLISHLFAILVRLGGFGLLLLGVVDSSFLFFPLGNDLLMIALTARNHKMFPFLAAMATVGSVLGCLLLDIVARAGGREGLSKIISGRQLQYVERRIEKRAGWAIAIACVMPPPFPFTGMIAGASAFQYPRKKLLSIVGLARLVRFSIVGVLAVMFGERILRWAKRPAVRGAILLLVAVCVVGSVISAVTWIKRSRRA
ncbi:MAG TPA: VTT domain-containing protein [Bryobacteraceae bacterium]|nr:VTT domain-containing protein [Bryobacteraceae bacterium]